MVENIESVGFDPEIVKSLKKLTKKDIARLSFVMPSTVYSDGKDPDGFEINVDNEEEIPDTRKGLQNLCWKKFHENPFINTAIRRIAGRMTGLGFKFSSEVYEIEQAMEEIQAHPLNNLHNRWKKFVIRSLIEGELFLLFTVHEDGFVEIDYINPTSVRGMGVHDGIMYHPQKKSMPLLYNVEFKDIDGFNMNTVYQIPSINIARFPSLLSTVKKSLHFDPEAFSYSQSTNRRFKNMGGCFRFMVAWDKGLETRRNISYLKTIIKWLNTYEQLKEIEIQHKKSSSAYLWVVEFEDLPAFQRWISLSDKIRKESGLMQKKVPGGTLFVPPGMTVTSRNPTLPKITDTDSDILQMVASGLNSPHDVLTGSLNATFASAKASRGPMSDTDSDEIAEFQNFLIYDFWASVFHLKSQVSNFPRLFNVWRCVGFKFNPNKPDKKSEPIFKKVGEKPEHLVDIEWPVSAIENIEGMTKAYLGVKHGPIVDTLGIPPSFVARKLGFNAYHSNRRFHALDKAQYPELVYSLDAESLQEKTESEPPNNKNNEENNNEVTDE